MYFVFNIDNNKLLEHQSIILEWFLKDHMTVKTGVMMLKIRRFAIKGINYIFKIYWNRKQLNQMYISQY